MCVPPENGCRDTACLPEALLAQPGEICYCYSTISNPQTTGGAVMSEQSTTGFSSRAGLTPRRRQGVQFAAAAVLALAVSGCSISASISDSVSSPFKWSSDSSGGSSEKKEQSYQDDVRDYAAVYFRSFSDIEGFRKGLTSIAARHGVTNWDSDQATYSGIGAGLGKAGVTAAQFDGYKTGLAQGDADKAAAMQKGYDKNRK
jgi:hypothetical protein